jgi:hypothetical protein
MSEHSSIDRIDLRPSLAAAKAKTRARLGCTRRSGRPSWAATCIRGRSYPPVASQTMARQPCAQDPVKASVMAATMSGSARRGPHHRRCRANPPKHRPQCIMGLQQRKGRLKPTGDELPWRTFRKKGKVLWRRIATRGGPTVRAQDRKGRTTDRDCLRTRVPSRIDLAVLPAILTADAKPPKNSQSTRTIQESAGALRPSGSPRRASAPRNNDSIRAQRALRGVLSLAKKQNICYAFLFVGLIRTARRRPDRRSRKEGARPDLLAGAKDGAEFFSNSRPRRPEAPRSGLEGRSRAHWSWSRLRDAALARGPQHEHVDVAVVPATLLGSYIFYLNPP